jgi:hypothetical protein
MVCFRHELLGGKWSRGDLLALLALLGVIAAVLAIPRMPKLFHWDSDSPSTHVEVPAKPVTPAPKPVHRVRDVTSGQVNFSCDQTLSGVYIPHSIWLLTQFSAGG